MKWLITRKLETYMNLNTQVKWSKTYSNFYEFYILLKKIGLQNSNI